MEDLGRLPITIHKEDIDCRTLSVPMMIKPDKWKEKFIFRDFWNTDWEASIQEGKFHGLAELLMEKYYLQDGNRIYISEIDPDTNHYRIECDIVSDQEYSIIAEVIERSEKPLHLDKFITSHLKRRTVAFGLPIVLNKLRQKLREDRRFKQVGNKWISVKHFQVTSTPPDLEPVPKEKTVKPSIKHGNVCRFKLTPEAAIAGEYNIGPSLSGEFEPLPDESSVRVQAYASTVLETSLCRNPLRLRGLRDFYLENNLKMGDIVLLKKMPQASPAGYRIYTLWEKKLEDLLLNLQKANRAEEIDLLRGATDLPLRYIIYLILSKSGRLLHYRDIHSRICTFRTVHVQTIEATLSEYNKRLFFTDNRGHWGLYEWPHEDLQEDKGKEHKDKGVPSAAEPIGEDEIMRRIAENDMVYQILRDANTPLSTAEICTYLSKILEVDSSVLEILSLINANDERLVRRPDGRWALQEWFEPSQEPEEAPLASVVGCPEPLAIPNEDKTTPFLEPAKTWKDNTLVLVILTLLIVLLGLGALAVILLLILK